MLNIIFKKQGANPLCFTLLDQITNNFSGRLIFEPPKSWYIPTDIVLTWPFCNVCQLTVEIQLLSKMPVNVVVEDPIKLSHFNEIKVYYCILSVNVYHRGSIIKTRIYLIKSFLLICLYNVHVMIVIHISFIVICTFEIHTYYIV